MYQELEKLMLEHNESAADLSRATGIPQNVISNWKARATDGGCMSFKNAKAISEHYGVPIETFMKGV